MKLLFVLVFAGVLQAQAVAQASGDTSACPVLTVSCPDIDAGSVTFSANLAGPNQPAKPTYEWSVSAGTIISGRGTNSITVDVSGLRGQFVTAIVAVGPVPGHCPNTNSCTIGACDLSGARKVDEYGALSIRNENARLDNFTADLKKEPTAQGYIISYAGRRAFAREAQERGERARAYIIKRHGLDKRRVVVMDGGHREQPIVELYIVPAGEAPPLSTPTIKPVEVRGAKSVKRRQ
jgi:hypothetical protein